jgi:regulator of sirC expression with transglutaminase-like and TPR domain
VAGTSARRPDLSLSMIVRNEAARLPAFLDALGDLADEICIIDTGSEDGTVSLLRARGCVTTIFPWCDDFSAARNAALRSCTGRWILSLDADERIAPEDRVALRALVRGPQNRCYRLVTRNYTDESTASGFVWSHGEDTRAAGFRGWFPSAKVRLFPNLPGVAFEGAVHELVHLSLERLGVQVADASVPVHHYPHLNQSPEARLRKQNLYLELGLKKVAENPRDARARHELGDQYVDMGKFPQALECYREALRLEPGNPLWLRDLGSVLLLIGQLPPALQALELSLRLDAENEEAWRNLGVARVRLDDWPGAREAFARALALNPEHPENQRYLAIAAQACGDRPRALALLTRLLERHPTHVEARTLYERLLSDE